MDIKYYDVSDIGIAGDVIRWTDSVNDPMFQEALLPGNPVAHVVTYNDDPEGPEYLAVCNGIYKGRVETHAFNDLRQACGFAWGMSLDEIKRAQDMSWGYIHKTTGTVCPEGNDTGDGFSYKDAFAFAMKSDEICYIPESEFDGTQANENGEFSLSDLGELSDGKVGYTYQDIVDICNGNEKVAEAVFEMSHWAGPSAEYEQLENWEIAEIIAGVDAYDHTFLDYLGEGYNDIPWPVYRDVHNDTLLAYCSTDPVGAPLNLSRLFVLQDGKNTPLNQIYNPEHEIRFVSTQGLKLPKCATIHNVHMQERSTFDITSLNDRLKTLSEIHEVSRPEHDAPDVPPFCDDER